MSEDEQLALLATDGMLVKRPLLVGRTSFSPASAPQNGKRDWDDPDDRLRPLDGITKIVFRQVWSQFFGGVDRYFIPFFSPTPHHLMTPRDLREVDFIHNAALPSVPQVMTKNANDFLWTCDVLKDMGYTEVNLNLGCPSGTVTAKGKAPVSGPSGRAGRFFDEVFSKNSLPVSVKTRLGYETPEEFAALLDLYNRYPIACLTIHPVCGRKNTGAGPSGRFADALANSRNPVCYNGDLRTVGEVRALEGRFPEVTHVMIGRGWWQTQRWPGSSGAARTPTERN